MLYIGQQLVAVVDAAGVVSVHDSQGSSGVDDADVDALRTLLVSRCTTAVSARKVIAVQVKYGTGFATFGREGDVVVAKEKGVLPRAGW